MGRTQVASCHFCRFNHILLEEDLEETDDEYQDSTVEDGELSHESDTLRYRLGSG